MKKVLLEIVDLLEKQSTAISGLQAQGQAGTKPPEDPASAANAAKGGLSDPFAQLRARIRGMPLE